MKNEKKSVRCTKPELRWPKQVGRRVLAICITCDRLHVVEDSKKPRSRR